MFCVLAGSLEIFGELRYREAHEIREFDGSQNCRLGFFGLVALLVAVTAFTMATPLRDIDGFIRNADAGVPVKCSPTSDFTAYLFCGPNVLGVDQQLCNLVLSRVPSSVEGM